MPIIEVKSDKITKKFQAETAEQLLPEVQKVFGSGFVENLSGIVLTGGSGPLAEGVYLWSPSVAGNSAGPGDRSAATGPAFKKVKITESTSTLAGQLDWHKYAYNPTSFTTSASALEHAAFFGFRPRECLPANVPPWLVSPVYSHLLEAEAAPAQPPPDLASASCASLYWAVRKLMTLGSELYRNEGELQEAFLSWNNTWLKAGTLTKPSSSSRKSSGPIHDGMYTVTSDGKEFMVAMLECKSDIGSGGPLVQALRYYQLHYKDGDCWASSSIYSADPLPALILLLEGPRLSFHAVWTICGNRVGYAPLTPSYYLTNGLGDTSNVWKLLAVLTAYKKTVRLLADAYLERSKHTSSLKARLRTEAHRVMEGGIEVERPCTLPYSLLDEDLGLTRIAFLGPGLLYTAQQRVAGGGERPVMVKFVAGRYGAQVHRVWHAAGVAPALHDVRQVGGSMLMVTMELLGAGWTSLREALPSGGEALREAVREALKKAHAVRLEASGGKAAHGDIRCPNIMVCKQDPSSWKVSLTLTGRDPTARRPTRRLCYPPASHGTPTYGPAVSSGSSTMSTCWRGSWASFKQVVAAKRQGPRLSTKDWPLRPPRPAGHSACWALCWRAGSTCGWRGARSGGCRRRLRRVVRAAGDAAGRRGRSWER